MRPVILARAHETPSKWTASRRVGAVVAVAAVAVIAVPRSALSDSAPSITIGEAPLVLGVDGRGSIAAKVAGPVTFGPGALTLDDTVVGPVSERLTLEAKNDRLSAEPVEGAPPWPKGGKYRAALTVWLEGPAQKTEQNVDLDLVVTAADAALPEKVTVRCRAGPLGSASCEGGPIRAPDKLMLSPVLPVSGVPLVATMASGRPSAGKITVNRDGSIEAKEFEVGTVSGKLLVRAGRVGEAATIPFEVQTRVTPVWLWVPLMILLGIVAGYFVRTRLDAKASLFERKAEGERLVVQIRQTEIYRNDEAEKKKLDEIIGRFRAAVRGMRTSAEVATALAGVQKDLEGVRARRAEERSAFDARAAALKDQLERYWVLPDPVATLVSAAQKVVAAARKKARAEDLSGAKAILDGLDELPKQLDEGVSGWLSRLGSGCPGVPGLPPAGVAEFEAARAAIPLGLPRPDALAILEGTHKAYRLGLAATSAMAKAIERIAADTAVSGIQSVAALREAFRKAWIAAGADLSCRCTALRCEGIALWDAVHPPAEREASLLLREARPRARGPDFGALIGSHATRARSEEAAGPGAALPEVARFEQRARGVRIVQTLLGGALVVASGTALLAPKFFGTWEDFVSVAAWGFTADVTLQKVVEFVGALKR